MILVLKVILLQLFSVLPDSPFTAYFEGLDWSFYDYLNWFLPLDNCSHMMSAWLLCIVFYYVWIVVLKRIVGMLIDKVLDKLLPLLLSFFA